MPTGKRHASLMQTFEMILEKIDHRIAPFNFVAAQEAASLMRSVKKEAGPGNFGIL